MQATEEVGATTWAEATFAAAVEATSAGAAVEATLAVVEGTLAAAGGTLEAAGGTLEAAAATLVTVVAEAGAEISVAVVAVEAGEVRSCPSFYVWAFAWTAQILETEGLTASDRVQAAPNHQA